MVSPSHTVALINLAEDLMINGQSAEAMPLMDQVFAQRKQEGYDDAYAHHLYAFGLRQRSAFAAALEHDRHSREVLEKTRGGHYRRPLEAIDRWLAAHR